MEMLRQFNWFCLLGKGWQCLRQHGFKVTWYKTRQVLIRRKSYAKWAEKQLFSEEELNIQRKKRFSTPLTFSIVVPLYNTPERFLREMVESVLAQTYGDWQLCLADGSDDGTDRERIVKEYLALGLKIVYKKLAYNGGISENTNASLKLAEGNYIALLDHDDILHPAALYEARRVIDQQNADFVYTDEAVFASPNIKAVTSIHFKPDFAPDNLLANNYICHFTVFKRNLLDEVGAFRCGYDGSQDHELFLRLTSKAGCVVHLPEVLYYWRAHPQSNAMWNVKGYAGAAGERAVRDFLTGRGRKAAVKSLPQCPTMYCISYELLQKPLISIIVLSGEKPKSTLRCLRSVAEKSTYKNWEILLLCTTEKATQLESCRELGRVRLLKMAKQSEPAAYNWAAEQARGQYLLILHDDTEVISPNWLEEMLMYAQQPETGAVGAMLYYPNDRIQHAGILLLEGEKPFRYAFSGVKRGSPGYMGRLCYAQNLSAVSSACFMIERVMWEELGGFAESYSVKCYDFDLCMRLRKRGLLIVWTPFAELYHFLPDNKKKKFRNSTVQEKRDYTSFSINWKAELAKGDPYYNLNFSQYWGDFTLR